MSVPSPQPVRTRTGRPFGFPSPTLNLSRRGCICSNSCWRIATKSKCLLSYNSFRTPSGSELLAPQVLIFVSIRCFNSTSLLHHYPSSSFEWNEGRAESHACLSSISTFHTLCFQKTSSASSLETSLIHSNIKLCFKRHSILSDHRNPPFSQPSKHTTKVADCYDFKFGCFRLEKKEDNSCREKKRT